jgi:hypothetical protein
MNEERVLHRISELSGSEGDLESLMANRKRKGIGIEEAEVIKWIA